MGAAFSKTELEERIKNKIGVEVVNKIKSSCQSAVDAHQKISLGNVSGSEVSGISQTIDPETALTSCQISAALNAVQGTDASQDLVNSLQQAQMTSGIGAVSAQNLEALKVIDSETDIALKNQIINECQQKIDVSQTFDVGNISDAKISDISQVNKTFNECVMEGLGDTVQKASAAQSTKSETKVEQVTQGLLGGEYGGLVLGMIVLGLGAMFLMGRSGSGSGNGSVGVTQSSQYKPIPFLIAAVMGIAAFIALGGISYVVYTFFNPDEETSEKEEIIEKEIKNSNSNNSEVSASNEEVVNTTTSETEKESFEGFNGDYYYNYI